MSDRQLRELQWRLAQDPSAIDHMVRALERRGDQQGLCALGFHVVDASRPGWRVEVDGHLYVSSAPMRAERRRQTGRAAWCNACNSCVEVYWIPSRRWSKHLDASHLNVCPASEMTIVGVYERTMPEGLLYGQVLANGWRFDVEWHRRAIRSTADLVARVENVSSGMEYVAASQNGSGLSVCFRMGIAPSAGATFSLSFDGDPDAVEQERYEASLDDVPVFSGAGDGLLHPSVRVGQVTYIGMAAYDAGRATAEAGGSYLQIALAASAAALGRAVGPSDVS